MEYKSPARGKWDEGAVKSNFTGEEYEKVVEAAKEYIKAGDIVQVVPSQRLSVPVSADPFDIYRALRAVNPSPYMYYLKLGDVKIAGSSPEVMVRTEEGRVTMRPIAGTNRRGSTEDEDAELAEELLADPKEQAEHVMLVDLGRNDVGRVCEYGSVKVDELMVIEKYSHVMHIVSNVVGRLRSDKDAFDVLRACLPAGTVSGAPKIRAMEIIDELEPSRRGTYAGAVGYFSFSGNSDTAIAIRTILIKDGIAYVQAGGGVVADSVPEKEYQETMNKARACMRAIQLAQEGLE
jgi:anthranilate synthase component 1